MKKTVRHITFLLVWISGFLSPAPAKSETVVRLPVMRIFSNVMKISFTADRNEIVESAEVTFVIPNSAASKRDVEIHDELLAIDHVSIKGMKYEDARILIDRDLKAGEERTFTFYGQRGFFNQHEIRYDFVVVGRVTQK